MPTFRRTVATAVIVRLDDAVELTGPGVNYPKRRFFRFYRMVTSTKRVDLEWYSIRDRPSFLFKIPKADARMLGMALLALAGSPREQAWAGPVVDAYEVDGLTIADACDEAGEPPSIEEWCLKNGESR